MIHNQDPTSQTENETPGAEHPNENYSEDTEPNKTLEVSTLCQKILPGDEITKGINWPKILPGDEITKGINWLNSKRR